jgi:hypothetical protein
MVGTVALRHEFRETSIDVNFTNKMFHRNLVQVDDFGICMAAMNYSGLLVASKAVARDLDDYEDDCVDDGDDAGERKKNSNL